VPSRPYVLLSCATSADGYLDDATSQRLILSGPADLDRVDELRAGCDAILVGARTVRTDNPRLLIRDPRRSARRAARGLPAHPARPQHPAGVPGGPVDVHDGQDDLQRGVVERLAGLLVHQLRQPAQVPGQVRLPGEQPDPPLGPAEPGPPRRGLMGLSHGGLYFAAPVYGEGGQHFPCRRIHCLKHRLTSKASVPAR